MNKAGEVDQMLALYAQYLAVSYSSNAERERNICKCTALDQELHHNHEKRRGNQTISLASKSHTQRSSSTSGLALKGSKLTENGLLQRDRPDEERSPRMSDTQSKDFAMQARDVKTRLYFMRGQAQLREAHPQLSEICEKFSDFKSHNGFFFAESAGRRNFELAHSTGLDAYVLINCFLTFMLSASLSDNRQAFASTMIRFRSLRAHATAQVFDYEAFLTQLDQVAALIDSDAVETAVALLVEYCSAESGFLSALLWSCKSMIGEFLETIKQNRRNSYTQKYYITDHLLFGQGSVKPEDNQLYKVARFCIEAFFIAVNGYCELIYIRKDGAEYHYKTIFINKPKDAQPKKRLLLYLLVVGEHHSLFSSFELASGCTDKSARQGASGGPEERSRPQPADVRHRNESADFCGPVESKPIQVVLDTTHEKQEDMSPMMSPEQRARLSERLHKALDFPADFCKSELTDSKLAVVPQGVQRAEFRTSHQAAPALQLNLQESSLKNQATGYSVSSRLDQQTGYSPHINLASGKLASTRTQSETVNLFDRENAVICLLACLEEMDANFERLAVQRRRAPREDLFARGRSFGRDAPQTQSKLTRTAGRSQDVGVGHRYTSGGRVNLMSSGLANGLAGKMQYKAERTQFGGRDNLYRGLNFKYTSTLTGPSANNYKYTNYQDSDFSSSLKKVVTSEHHAYVFN